MAQSGWDEALRRIEAERAAQTGALDLRGLGLAELPLALFELTWLESLALGRRRHSMQIGREPLVALPVALGRLGGLRSLAISETHIADLTPVAALTRVRSLDCSYTRVADLRPLADLTALQSLDCSDTGVADLRPLQGLTALQSLNCSSTQVADLRPLAPLSALRSLECSATQVADLQPLTALTALQSVGCSQTRVNDLRPLAALTALQSLHWSHTNVADLQPLAALTALQSIFCSHTQVADLRPLAALTALQSLVCHNTPVADLRPLATLTALQILACSSTGVADLRPLQALTALQYLNCSHTQIANLSPVAEHPELQALNAFGCRLADLPTALVTRPTLESLSVSSVDGLPPEVLSRSDFDNCLPRLRPHFADLAAGSEPLRTTKVIVLGNGRVGKTQLCRRLRGLDYDATVSSTHGIVIDAADFGDGETLNLWDFGGQDIYHGAHALFMRTRAVFVIAWHPDFEAAPTHEHEGMTFRNRPLAYWLSFVRAMAAAGSPIIAVQCQCESRAQIVRRLPVDPAVLDGLDVTTVAYSARTDARRGTLDDEIAGAIEALRARDGLASIGVGRARVIDRLHALRAADQARPAAERTHRVLSVADFEALCAEVGGVSSPGALLDYLHQCGLVFYDAERFAGRLLLDISWALDAVYAVFDRGSAWRHLQATGGRFTRALLGAAVWRGVAGDEQRLFVQLMLSCGICFRHAGEHTTPSDDDEYIAPDLLPAWAAVADQLDGRWAEDDPSLCLSHCYEFLHPGLFRGLMARVGGRAERAGVYWRGGLWIYRRSTRTRVRIDATDGPGDGGRIHIRMQGHDAELADWLRAQLDEQHRRFGQIDHVAEVDELPTDRAGRRAEAPIEGAPCAPAAPTFEPMPPEEIGRAAAGPRVYISYARSDGSPQAEQSARLTQAMAAALEGHGIDVVFDQTGTRLGDRLGAFMDRLIEGDFIIVVLGDKSLRSPFCMYELFGIWQRSQRDGDAFLKRVLPLLLPGTGIDTIEARVAHAAFWKDRHAELESLIRRGPELIAPGDFEDFRRVGEYRLHVAEMLRVLADRLMPRDLEALAAGGFAELLPLMVRG